MRVLAILLLFSLCPAFCPALCFAEGDDRFEIRELWRGEFRQKTPLPWTGKMELFLRYRTSEDYPRAVDGTITWPALGGARTRVSGLMSDSGIQFFETGCVNKRCSQIILGGEYDGSFNELRSLLIGEATGKFGLGGSFRLERILLPE